MLDSRSHYWQLPFDPTRIYDGVLRVGGVPPLQCPRRRLDATEQRPIDGAAHADYVDDADADIGDVDVAFRALDQPYRDDADANADDGMAACRVEPNALDKAFEVVAYGWDGRRVTAADETESVDQLLIEVKMYAQ